MGKAAEVLHGREHRIPAADGTHQELHKFLMSRIDTKNFGLKKASRIKAFVLKFVSVPAKWIRTARQYQLNIYTDNKSYQNPFALTDD